MPIEHNAAQTDHDPDQPHGFEKWVEIDVDEGGFSSATHGVMIEWSGKWPNYNRKIYGPGNSNFMLDRTKYHLFGFRYDAVNKTATWSIDNTNSKSFQVPWMPEHKYFAIMTAASHKLNKPYTMYVKNIKIRN
jgi:hypothetical protein